MYEENKKKIRQQRKKVRKKMKKKNIGSTTCKLTDSVMERQVPW